MFTAFPIGLGSATEVNALVAVAIAPLAFCASVVPISTPLCRETGTSTAMLPVNWYTVACSYSIKYVIVPPSISYDAFTVNVLPLYSAVFINRLVSSGTTPTNGR